jgi:hypothetical protein
MEAITQAKAITDGQRKQIDRFLDDVLEKVAVKQLIEELGLDSSGAQRVIEHGDEFANAIRNAATISLKDLSVSDKFKDEEVESRYGYLSGYKPKSIAEQIAALHKLFPELGSADEKLANTTLPPNAEGWFAIPRWEKIAGTYGEAVQKVLDLIKQTRNGKLYNYREGQLGPKYLRQHTKTESAFQKLGDEQKDHDILVIPAQFGLNHRGRSVRRAREVMNASEFGLSAFAIGIMILTHPERLQHYDDLYIDCAGDEFSPGADGVFSDAPFFDFDDGEVYFSADGVGSAYDYYGSASGFVPQF